jgi:hypothetical protein
MSVNNADGTVEVLDADGIGSHETTWFSNWANGQGPLPRPALRVLNKGRFLLVDSFYYSFPPYAVHEYERARDNRIKRGMTPLTSVVISDDAPYIKVTRRRETDLASVPNLIWGLMASYGKQTLPALLHDMLCDEASDRKKEGDRQRAYQDRRFADNLIRHALRSTGVDWFRRWNFWAGVTFGRYFKFQPWLGVLVALLAAAASVVFYTGLGMLFVQALPGLSLPSDVPQFLDWTELGPWGWASDGWRPLVLTLTPFVLSAVLVFERLWSLLWVAAVVLLPVLALALTTVLIATWIRVIPWLVMKGLDQVPGVRFDPGPFPRPWGGAISLR